MPRRDDDYDERDYDERDYDERDERDHDERERSERRGDEMAHRGGLILAFGIISCVLGVASILFTCLTAAIGLPFGILAWTWGRKDMRAMDAGEMDPEGRGQTQAGFIIGIIGTILCSLFVVLIGLFLLVYVIILGFALGGR